MTLPNVTAELRRKLVSCQAHCVNSDVNGAALITDDPISLMRSYAQIERWTLLAYAYDGVIWGVAEAGSVCTAPILNGFTPPLLRTETLQQARLFHSSKEVLIWRIGGGQYRYRVVDDSSTAQATTKAPTDAFAEFFDEDHLLWGTHVEASATGFTLTRHGSEGLHHALPLPPPANCLPNQPLEIAAPVMIVRHYLADSPAGRIALSRLVALRPLQAKPAVRFSQEKK